MQNLRQLEPRIADYNVEYYAFLLSNTRNDIPVDNSEMQMHVNICSKANVLKLETPKRKDEFIAECILGAVVDAAKLPSINVLFIRTRKAVVRVPRQIAMYLMCKHTKMGVKAIGKYFAPNKAKFDHSTVIHSRDKIQDLIDAGDEKIIELYNDTVVVFENLSGVHINQGEK